MPHTESTGYTKLASTDKEAQGEVRLSTDFEGEIKLSQSDKTEDKIEYVFKKALATIKPKTEIITQLQKKHQENPADNIGYLADLKAAEKALVDEKKREEDNLNNLSMMLSLKNYAASLLCCVGAVFCLHGMMAGAPYVATGAGGLTVAKGQDYWAKRGLSAIEHDLQVIREEIGKTEAFLRLQTGSKVSASGASLYSQSGAGLGLPVVQGLISGPQLQHR